MSWQTAGSSFDPNKFYPDGILEGKGFKSDLRVRISDEMYALAERFARDTRLPVIETTSDLVRDSVVRGFDYYFNYIERHGEEPDPDMVQTYKTMLAGMKVREKAARRKHVTESIKELEQEMNSASPQYLVELIEDAEAMLDGAFHQEHINDLTRLLAKYKR